LLQLATRCTASERVYTSSPVVDGLASGSTLVGHPAVPLAVLLFGRPGHVTSWESCGGPLHLVLSMRCLQRTRTCTDHPASRRPPDRERSDLLRSPLTDGRRDDQPTAVTNGPQGTQHPPEPEANTVVDPLLAKIVDGSL